MDALSYEYLLRRIYQVGRSGKKGADADYYRELEHAEVLYKIELENIKNRQVRASTKSIANCFFVGLGIGKLFERPCIGILIGIGVGLLLISLLASRTYKKLVAFNKEKV